MDSVSVRSSSPQLPDSSPLSEWTYHAHPQENPHPITKQKGWERAFGFPLGAPRKPDTGGVTGEYMNLSSQQQRIVDHTRGPLLAVSGPGSGKTTVIVHRAARLISEEDVHPDNLLVVTFSRRAADEMRGRIQRLLRGTGVQITREQFATIHSFGYQIVHRHRGRPQVLGGSASDRLLRGILADEGLYDRRDPQSLHELQSEISYLRSHRIDPSDEGSGYEPQVLTRDELVSVVDEYRHRKKVAGVSDFADLLEDALHLLKTDARVRDAVQGRYRHVMLDEAQDTSPLQFELIVRAAAPENNLVVVGDDDQAIYSFRGGSPDTMLDFGESFPEAFVVKLTTNYRSAPDVVDLSRKIIEHNSRRYGKGLKAHSSRESDIRVIQPPDTDRQTDEVVKAASAAHAFERPGQMTVIYRTNVQAVPIIDRLVDDGLPFRLLSSAGRDMFRRTMIEDMTAFLHLVNDPEQPRVADVVRLMNKPTRYIPHALLLQLQQQLPAVTGDVWSRLLNHRELSAGQRGKVADLYTTLVTYATRYRSRTDYQKLDDMLSDRTLGYGAHLRNQAADHERRSIYYGQFRTFQLLARRNDFIERIANIRSQVGRAVKSGDDDPGLVLTTCHSAKGLEWPHVWVIDLLEGVQPFPAAGAASSIGDEEEERRLFYVAVTRTIESLTVSIPRKYAGVRATASRFAAEAGLGDQGSKRDTGNRQALKRRPGSSRADRPADAKTRTRPELKNPITHPAQLKPGTRLVHTRYGEVTVDDVDASKELVRVRIPDGDLKDLHIPTCIDNGLIGHPDDDG